MKVIPVSEKTQDYAEQVYAALCDAGIRADLDGRNEKVGYKIREARMVDRAPYLLVVGAKEAESGNVSVRNRDTDETTVMELAKFTEGIKAEIDARALHPGL